MATTLGAAATLVGGSSLGAGNETAGRAGASTLGAARGDD